MKSQRDELREEQEKLTIALTKGKQEGVDYIERVIEFKGSGAYKYLSRLIKLEKRKSRINITTGYVLISSLE